MPPRETKPGPQAHLTELLFSIRDPGLPAALVALVSHVCLIQFSTCSTILKEINPEYSLEGLMLKLKPQFSGHLMGRADWFNSIADSVDMSLNKRWETMEVRGAWRAAVHEVAKSWTQVAQ